MVDYLGRPGPGWRSSTATPAHLGKLLAERGVDHVDAVVCGLPWALFDEPTQARLLTEVGARDRPDRGVHHLRLPARHGAARAARRFRRTLRVAVRGSDRHRDGVAQHAAGVRLRVPQADAELVTRAETASVGRIPAREILRLAGPALPVLAAEPLYLLVDTAVVGQLGAVPLAGLAVAAVMFAQVTSQLNFLSYGTTARTARLLRRRLAGPRPSPRECRRPGSRWRRHWSCSSSAQVFARPVAGTLGAAGARSPHAAATLAADRGCSACPACCW